MTYTESEFESLPQGDFNIGLTFIDDLLTEKEGKKVLNIQKFYFNKDQATITPKIQMELDKIVDAVQRFPQLKLSIESHTNSKGSANNNNRLSQRRSEAIKTYLTTNGLTASNISAIGFGEDKLINKCADGVYCLEFLHNQNERTLIVVTNLE